MLNIKPPLFNVGEIHVYTDREAMQEAVSSSGYEEGYLDGVSGIVFRDIPGVFQIGWFDGKIGTLVHECLHATIRYLAYVGVTLQHDEANEVYAYFQEWLVTAILEAKPDSTGA